MIVNVIQRKVWLCGECAQEGIIQPGHFLCEFPKPWDGLKDSPNDSEEPRELEVNTGTCSEKELAALKAIGVKL